jgi:uncharacterized SAM-binding protein YcdF (DUF218 family)
LALFLGGFSLLNLLASLGAAGFDANLWWIDLHFLPKTLARAFLLTGGACLLAFAFDPPRSGLRRWLTLACTGGLTASAAINSVQFYLLLARGNISSGMPIALSLFVTGALALIFLQTLRPLTQRNLIAILPLSQGKSRGKGDRGGCEADSHSFVRCRRGLEIAGICVGCTLLFPVLQMLCFGKTDYRRPADVAVVLGARAYADGRPSDALADRVRTACQLYHNGLARKLIFSGGPGDGAIHETQAMKRMALNLGVKEEDVLLDAGGLSTRATVRNTELLFSQLHASRVLVVSHFYHLPRIKMTYHRTGWEVYTVPAKQSYILRQLPFNMAREVAALWVYYVRGLAA